MQVSIIRQTPAASVMRRYRNARRVGGPPPIDISGLGVDSIWFDYFYKRIQYRKNNIFARSLPSAYNHYNSVVCNYFVRHIYRYRFAGSIHSNPPICADNALSLWRICSGNRPKLRSLCRVMRRYCPSVLCSDHHPSSTLTCGDYDVRIVVERNNRDDCRCYLPSCGNLLCRLALR